MILTVPVLLLGAVYVIHDAQSAEGVGLYFALKTGAERKLWDLLVDLVCSLVLFGMILAPYLLNRQYDPKNIAVMTVLTLAFVTPVSIAYFLHGENPIRNLFGSTPLRLLQTLFPILCILVILLWEEFGKISFLLPRGTVLVLALAGTLLPWGLRDLFDTILSYAAVWVTYELYLGFRRKNKEWNVWKVVLFLGLSLRALYVLIMVAAKF